MSGRCWLILGLAWAACRSSAFASDAGRAADNARPVGAVVGESGPSLHWARSDDGLRFSAFGEAFRRGADAPELVLRPNGDLLAYFFASGSGSDSAVTRWLVARSQDEGATWSRPRKARFHGPAAAVPRIGRGALVSQADGLLRYYFATGREGAGARGSVACLASATSRNGLDYRLEPPARSAFRKGQEFAPTACLAGEEWTIFLSLVIDDRDGENGRPPIHAMTARDGRNFSPPRPAQLKGVDSLASIISTENGYRAYAIADGTVRSLVSRDGRSWAPEPGDRFREASDAAVVRLKSGAYLMLYVPNLGGPHEATGEPAAAKSDLMNGGELEAAGGAPADGDLTAADEGAGADAAAWDEATDADGLPIGPTEAIDEEVALLQDASSPEMGGDVPALEGEGYDPSYELPDEWPDDGADVPAHEDAILAEAGFAPRPNFDEPIDYLAWYRDRILCRPADNAYDAYAEFLPGPGEEADWPPMENMFTGENAGAPEPWDPAEHPEWEASHEATEELRGQFREATRHTGYALAPSVSPEATEESDGVSLLMNLLLPHLGSHRQLAKATIAGAWRLENGEVSAERMLDAWETTLRGAGHMGQGATLIESLVGVAERSLVQDNARWALAQGVFGEDELQSALDTLTEFDRDSGDPVRGLHGEHAFAMDITQYLFAPEDAAQRERRLSKLFANGMAGDDAPGTERYDCLARMTREDAGPTLNAFDAYYREVAGQMRTGYPAVRAADLDSTAEHYLNTSPLTETFLPALSRVHQLRARGEASRRATQLAYAVHLFKAQNGRWPDHLDELPGESAARMRTDPFTGSNFGYRLSDSGPTIYSLSENGRDDGGTHSPRWNDGVTEPDVSDDHVFWPPQKK